MKSDKLIKYSVPVFAIAVISHTIKAISFVYYLVPVLCVVYIVLMFFDSKFRADKENTNTFKLLFFNPGTSLFIFAGVWFLITSLWSSYPDVSASRALYFILLCAGCISAGMLWLNHSGKGTLDFLLPSNIIVVLICLFSIITNIPQDNWTGGNGKGIMSFFAHQNTLASIILLTLPSVFNKLLKPVKSDQLSVTRNSKSFSNYKALIFYSLLLATNLLLLTITYSRSAILALICGLIIFLFLNRNRKVIVYGFAITAGLIISVYFISSLNQTVVNIINKDFPEFYSSRMWMWEPSYKAAMNGGLTGIGYGISSPEIRPGGFGDHFEGERFVREKGNSVLALIEETGLIGLILFLFPILYVLNKSKLISRKIKPGPDNYRILLLYSSLIAFVVHAQFEAWWVGVGSVQLPLFFIYIGLLVRPVK